MVSCSMSKIRYDVMTIRSLRYFPRIAYEFNIDPIIAV